MKKNTYFIDIDGTILKHRFDDFDDPMSVTIPIKKSIDAINQLKKEGHKIILTTARNEYMRNRTMDQLTEANCSWDQLVMGCTTGVRVVINDRGNHNTHDRTQAIDVDRDRGFDYNDLFYGAPS